ncbi:hypothetical protein [Streptomyces antibioticus]|uniref:hypothetical protein n=1 Tax=Streptomyces antibioticus TaxID=1890 RepID=UPI0033B3C984
MDITRCLATVDLLCTREFPAEYGRTDVGPGGPGWLAAALQISRDFWEDDGTAWEETVDQYEADRDGLSERLADCWGPPYVISLASVLERSMEGEDIPEPWDWLAQHVPDVHLWRHPAAPRWVALGVSQWDRELPFELLALATETDPP